MPECYRCGRVQPTGELRRTTRGQVCKEGSEFGKASDCLRIEKARKQAEREARQERRAA